MPFIKEHPKTTASIAGMGIISLWWVLKPNDFPKAEMGIAFSIASAVALWTKCKPGYFQEPHIQVWLPQAAFLTSAVMTIFVNRFKENRDLTLKNEEIYFNRMNKFHSDGINAMHAKEFSLAADCFSSCLAIFKTECFNHTNALAVDLGVKCQYDYALSLYYLKKYNQAKKIIDAALDANTQAVQVRGDLLNLNAVISFQLSLSSFNEDNKNQLREESKKNLEDSFALDQNQINVALFLHYLNDNFSFLIGAKPIKIEENDGTMHIAPQHDILGDFVSFLTAEAYATRKKFAEVIYIHETEIFSKNISTNPNDFFDMFVRPIRCLEAYCQLLSDQSQDEVLLLCDAPAKRQMAHDEQTSFSSSASPIDSIRTTAAAAAASAKADEVDPEITRQYIYFSRKDCIARTLKLINAIHLFLDNCVLVNKNNSAHYHNAYQALLNFSNPFIDDAKKAELQKSRDKAVEEAKKTQEEDQRKTRIQIIKYAGIVSFLISGCCAGYYFRKDILNFSKTFLNTALETISNGIEALAKIVQPLAPPVVQPQPAAATSLSPTMNLPFTTVTMLRGGDNGGGSSMFSKSGVIDDIDPLKVDKTDVPQFSIFTVDVNGKERQRMCTATHCNERLPPAKWKGWEARPATGTENYATIEARLK